MTVQGESLSSLDSIHLGRSLLQDEGGEDLLPKESEKEKEEEKKEEEPILPSSGPTRFYYEKDADTKVLLEVKKGIILTVFKEGEVWDKFLLDKEAKGGMTGSLVKGDQFKVDIDWKKQEFEGLNNPQNKISGLQIEMKFDKKKDSFVLIDLKIVNLAIQKLNDIDLEVSTSHGYKVMAPLGLSFGCYAPGMFRPKGNFSEQSVSAGLTFPDLQLQVYKVHKGRFGPVWECGDMIPIGLWVGILITLMFASICAWGFTMLANINGPDRFDDPKKPGIYVPQTD
eukprot:TRINITY_DN23373_c0_g1_i1.p1 TRINITY_DN23373_c0_g1~~TRINITY_DN23373_c0_g1_i1.p1  ORF type:complete len:283 (-),score=77.93 TRINITY_DN23373_c0_g1_i1:192-1040(-)